MEKPSFGKPLEEHLTISGREIAFPIEACVTMLLECGMQEEVRLGAAWPGLGRGFPPRGWSLQDLLLCYPPHPPPRIQTREDIVQPLLPPTSLDSPRTVAAWGTWDRWPQHLRALLQPFFLHI